MTDLSERWPQRLASEPALRDRLIEAYADPARGYHDTRHLVEVLDRLDTLLAQPEAANVDRDAVVLAAWFHDAVYDGHRDDEERSADLAEETLASTDVPAALVAEVARLVRLTERHRADAGDVAGALLCDADVAILAADPERYDAYVRGVRAEYSQLDDAAFDHGRAEVLRRLLEGPLFHTPLARELWEDRARANVEAELLRLTAGAPPGRTR